MGFKYQPVTDAEINVTETLALEDGDSYILKNLSATAILLDERAAGDEPGAGVPYTDRDALLYEVSADEPLFARCPHRMGSTLALLPTP